ncbi:glycosyltransferase [Sulfitobacter sp. LCG007]
MTAGRVSVVVVSNGRPAELALCLTSLSRQQGVAFEIVVVADAAGLSAASGLPFAEHLKCVAFDAPNISAARNLGVGHAAGEVIAFIDDDAVAEPSWLKFLAGPFSNPSVAAATGFVRGANGISFQRRGQQLDAAGLTLPLDVDAGSVSILPPPANGAIKTEGTNMCFSRSVLVELGGFDEAFHYYHDETDLDMRLARQGYLTAVVPMAQVHHKMAPNRCRGPGRVPRDLFDIGAGWAVFHRKHLPAECRPGCWTACRAAEIERLQAHSRERRIGPRELDGLVQRLDAGHAEGTSRPSRTGSIAPVELSAFHAFPAPARRARLLHGSIWSRRRLRRVAAIAAAGGCSVTVIELSPTVLYHRVSFMPEGYWLQTGGLFGRSTREDPLLSLYSHGGRVTRERDRVGVERML